MEVSVGFACCCCCCYSYLNGRNEGGKGGAGPPLPNSTLCVSHPIVFIFTFRGGPQRGQNQRIYSTDPTKRLLFYISQSRVAASFAHHHHHHRRAHTVMIIPLSTTQTTTARLGTGWMGDSALLHLSHLFIHSFISRHTLSREPPRRLLCLKCDFLETISIQFRNYSISVSVHFNSDEPQVIIIMTGMQFW